MQKIFNYIKSIVIEAYDIYKECLEATDCMLGDDKEV